jgi:hypothetical protein
MIDASKYDLTNVAFIIPFQHNENFHRIENLSIVLHYILGNFDTNVYIKETGADSFRTHILPWLTLNKIDVSKIRYYHEEQKYEFFPKTRILNDLLEKVTQYCLMNDADIILPINSYFEGLYKITEEGYDFVIPFCDNRNWLIPLIGSNYYSYPDNIFLTVNSNLFDHIKMIGGPVGGSGPTGGVHIMRYDSYVNGYMENENFAGYGPEDQEKLYRFKSLGYKVGRVE